VNPDSVDGTLRLLANHRRRQLLRILQQDRNSVKPLTELVDRLLAESEFPSAVGTTSRQALRIELIHQHLPMLAQAAVIEYSHGDEAVRYQPTNQIEVLLETIVTLQQVTEQRVDEP